MAAAMTVMRSGPDAPLPRARSRLTTKGSGMRVTCDIEETTLTNDEGYDVDSIEATCGQCGHVTESFSVDEPSIRRCLALMREECPRGQWNFYVGSDC